MPPPWICKNGLLETRKCTFLFSGNKILPINTTSSPVIHIDVQSETTGHRFFLFQTSVTIVLA